MTVVEVVVAAMILAIGALALATLVNAASHTSYRAEQSQVVSNRLQEELEKIKQLPYAQVALTAIPTDTSDLSDPRWRVSGTSYATSKDGANLEPLVYNGSALYAGGTVTAGTIDPTPIPFQSGDVTGTIFRFVTWENDESCLDTQCPGSQDLKRVTVAIRIDPTSAGGTRTYQELQARVHDPDVEPVDNDNPIPPGTDDTKPWTFWLSDTPCNFDARQPITGEHLTHNGRGVCSTGLQTGNNPGAPDVMFTNAPPFNPEQPLYDYSTDVEPVVNPALDKGLQIISQTATGCPIDSLEIQFDPDTDPTNFQRVHKWVSEPVPEGYDILFDGTATLSLWTQTVNTLIQGKICVWLFIRQTNIFGFDYDTAIVNLDPPLVGANYFSYAKSDWPTIWTEIRVPLHFPDNIHLLENSRLGVAVAVDKTGTGNNGADQGLQFLYDEPSFDSRLEIKTHSTLPTF
jgi:type II secretory pathway pseudopilin PulG